MTLLQAILLGALIGLLVGFAVGALRARRRGGDDA